MICFGSAVGRRRDIWARHLFELRYRWAERHLSPAICLSSATGERRGIWDYILLSGKALSIKNIPIRCHYTEFWKLCQSNQAALRGFVLKHCFCLIFSLWCLSDREDSLWCKKSIYCRKKRGGQNTLLFRSHLSVGKHPLYLSPSVYGREMPALFESISYRQRTNACSKSAAGCIILWNSSKVNWPHQNKDSLSVKSAGYVPPKRHRPIYRWTMPERECCTGTISQHCSYRSRRKNIWGSYVSGSPQPQIITSIV